MTTIAYSPKRQIRSPTLGDEADLEASLAVTAADLDDVAGLFAGTLAGRPTATAAAGHAAGNPGSFWLATDTGQMFVSFGGAWYEIGMGVAAIPIGGKVSYAGVGDPAGGKWLLTDGRLIDKTTYSSFFTAVGHAYNGGVDPGGNQVRIPDSRGRTSVGADNMGTAAGAANRLPNTNRAIGQTHGEERHQLTTAELPAHSHIIGPFGGGYSLLVQVGGSAPNGAAAGSTYGSIPSVTENTGTNTFHNVVQPGQVDNMIVRVA